MTNSTTLAQKLENFVQPDSGLSDAFSADALSADALSADALSADMLSDDALSADCLSDHSPSRLRVIAIGSLPAVNHHVMRMYQLGYAQPHEWSRPLPTGNPQEVMRILTKRLVGLEG